MLVYRRVFVIPRDHVACHPYVGMESKLDAKCWGILQQCIIWVGKIMIHLSSWLCASLGCYLDVCLEVIGSTVRINELFHLLRNGVYWGYSPLTDLLLTSWDILSRSNTYRLRAFKLFFGFRYPPNLGNQKKDTLTCLTIFKKKSCGNQINQFSSSHSSITTFFTFYAIEMPLSELSIQKDYPWNHSQSYAETIRCRESYDGNWESLLRYSEVNKLDANVPWKSKLVINLLVGWTEQAILWVGIFNHPRDCYLMVGLTSRVYEVWVASLKRTCWGWFRWGNPFGFRPARCYVSFLGSCLGPTKLNPWREDSFKITSNICIKFDSPPVCFPTVMAL